VTTLGKTAVPFFDWEAFAIFDDGEDEDITKY
jgi:hypothetical protein